MRAQVIDLVNRYLGRCRPSGGTNVTLKCPFHKGGQETRPSFGVDIDQGIGHCFTCGVSGSLMKLMQMLGVSKEEIDREVGDLRQIIRDNLAKKRERADRSWHNQDPHRAACPLKEKVASFYGQFCPERLVRGGFYSDLLHHMEVGFDPSANRIMYPIRDAYGNLAGYSAGWNEEEQQPKYKVYQGMRKDLSGKLLPSDYGPWFDEEYPEYGTFHNHDYLWNFHNLYPRFFFGKEEKAYLIIVEGFKACLWLLQHGFWNTVALMGSKMTQKQHALLQRINVDLLLFLDNDDAGIEGTHKIGKRLYQERPGVFCSYYPIGSSGKPPRQPDELTYEGLCGAVSEALSYPLYSRG